MAQWRQQQFCKLPGAIPTGVRVPQPAPINMKLFRYLWRGLFGPKCPCCKMRDFEWKCGSGKDGVGVSAWELKCHVCGAEYWKFKGTDNRLFEFQITKELSYKAGNKPTKYECDKMINTFDGRIVCPDCEHYPLCGSPGRNGEHKISCTQCGSEFSYNYQNPIDIIRITDRMPNEAVQVPSAPEPDRGFLLEGSL